MVYVEESYVSEAVGVNLADGKKWSKVNYPRKIVRMALVGGAAANDAAVDVFYGDQYVATLRNFYTGSVDKEKMLWHNSQIYCPKGTPITVKVIDALSATETILALDIVRVRGR